MNHSELPDAVNFEINDLMNQSPTAARVTALVFSKVIETGLSDECQGEVYPGHYRDAIIALIAPDARDHYQSEVNRLMLVYEVLLLLGELQVNPELPSPEEVSLTGADWGDEQVELWRRIQKFYS